jgi:hypothetical protein
MLMSTKIPPRKTDDEISPYAPPQARLDEEPAEMIPVGDAAAEVVRRAHIGHEASIKSIALLHLLGMLVGFLAAALLLAVAGLNLGPPGAVLVPTERVKMVIASVICFAFGGLHWALRLGLARFQSWARWTDVVGGGLLLFIGLLAGLVFLVAALQRHLLPRPLIVVGIVDAVLGYILYVLLSSKATVIFAAEYRAVIAQTPHIRHRTGIVVKFCMALLVGFIVLCFLAALVGYAMGSLPGLQWVKFQAR